MAEAITCDSFRGNLLQVTRMPSLWYGDRLLARRARLATSALARMRGLAFRPAMIKDEALVLEPARQIHTIGMRFDIDALFCDADWKVVHIIRGLRPNRITRWVPASRRVIELIPGTIPLDLQKGDRLELRGRDQT